MDPLSGLVIKKDSSSSGLFRVKVYNQHGMAQRNGTGMFPRDVVQKPLPSLAGRLLPNAFPLLPLEEEGRLNDMPLREDFIPEMARRDAGAASSPTPASGTGTN